MEGSPANLSHAWNKVNIGGKWYNCDLTHDGWLIKEGGKPTRCLLTNEEFKDLGYIEDGYEEFESPKEKFNQEIIKSFFEQDHNEVSKKIKTRVISPEKLANQILNIRDFYKEPIYISLSKADDKHYAIKFKRKLQDGFIKNISNETPMFEIARRGEFLAKFEEKIGIKKTKKGCIIGNGIILKASKNRQEEETKLEEIR